MTRTFRTSLKAYLFCILLSAAAACGTNTTATPVPTITSAIPVAPNTPTTAQATSTPITTAPPNSPLPISPLPPPTPPTHANSPIDHPAPNPNPGEHTPTYSYRVVNAFPHDPDAFTEGLIFHDGWLYESTGLRGKSSLRKVDLASGAVVQSRELPSELFGEGATVFGEQMIQLTWNSNVGFVYDKHSLEMLGEFHYPTEGWGLTHDGDHLIMSDGTATLRFLDPETFDELWQVQVYDENGPVVRLNELEYIDGEVYANVWQTDRIAIIDPGWGRVQSWLDLTGLLQSTIPDRPVDVLNGIAYDAVDARLFVTGKWWPELYEIAIVKDTRD